MSTAYKISEKGGIYFLTFQIVGWVDIFTMLQLAKISIYIFLLTITIYSCRNVVKNNKSNNSNKDYLSSDHKLWKNVFPDSLTKHFPKKLNQDVISYGASYRNTRCKSRL